MDGQPAPDFRLVNQFGEEVALADLRGKVVVLTFLYTTCPDICPITAGKLGQVHDRLVARADDVVFLAITVDPARDSLERVRQYLEAQRLERKMQFLTGGRAALEDSWAAYQITVAQGPAAAATGDASGFYEVVHNDRLYVIDKAGRERLLLRSDFAPEAMVGTLEALLRE